MKQIIITLLFALEVCCVSAQNLTSAFFVFRNDGPVLPFFYEDVDSIRQSKIDTDSIERPEFVTTEFWTSDSVYRVPIASIDSIAFRTPSEIRKPRSKEISDELLSYLVTVDSLTLKFSPSVPKSILPEKGDKLTYSNSHKLMPCGFLGEVRSIDSQNECVSVQCDSISLGDAFERLYLVGDYKAIDDTDPYRQSRSPINGDINLKPIETNILLLKSLGYDEGWELSYPGEDFDFGISSNVYIKLRFVPHLKYIVDFEGEESSHFKKYGLNFPYFVHIDLSGPFSIETNIQLNGSVSYEFDLSKFPPPISIDVPIYTPYTGNLINFEAHPKFNLNGSIALDFNRRDIFDIGLKFTHLSSDQVPDKVNLYEFKARNPELKVGMYSTNISLFSGWYAGLYFGRGPLKLVYGGFSIGWNLKHDFMIGLREFESAEKETELYDRFIAKNVLTSSAKCEAELGSKFEKVYDLKSTLWSWEVPVPEPIELSIFPKFSELKYIEDGAETHLEVDVEGPIYLPVYPGIKVVDKDGNVLFKEFKEEWHWLNDTHVEFPYLHKTFNKPCTAYPVFKIFDKEITASPSLNLNLKATPVTDDAFAGSTDATLQGHLEMNSSTLLNITAVDYTVGFCYSTSSGNVKDGKVVECKLRTDRTFEANISGLNEDTDYYYCAFITTDTITEYGEVRHFYTKEAEEIDLGLSVNWRAWNVGSNHSYEYGNHYAWGEKNVKGEYSWSSYFDNPYNGKEWIGCSVDTDISGVYERDASKDLGEDWRMPTREEMQELLDKCEWEWHTVEGVDGYKVTGPSRRSIFLPANGLIDGSSLNNTGTYGAYWTSTPQADTEGKATAATLYFYGGMLKSLQWANRYAGRAVRPVRDKQ